LYGGSGHWTCEPKERVWSKVTPRNLRVGLIVTEVPVRVR